MVFFVRNITLDSFRKTKRPYSLIESTARLRVIKIIRYVHFPLPQNELQVHRDALSVLMGFFVYGASMSIRRYAIKDVKLSCAIDSHNPRLILSNICGKRCA